MYQKAVSYISQADALNFLLNLHTWSWYARRSGTSCGHRERVECKKTFQASSQEDRPSMRHFFSWEGTKAKGLQSGYSYSGRMHKRGVGTYMYCLTRGH